MVVVGMCGGGRAARGGGRAAGVGVLGEEVGGVCHTEVEERRSEQGSNGSEGDGRRTREALQEHLKAPLLHPQLSSPPRSPLQINPIIIKRRTRQAHNLRPRNDVGPELAVEDGRG